MEPRPTGLGSMKLLSNFLTSRLSLSKTSPLLTPSTVYIPGMKRSDVHSLNVTMGYDVFRQTPHESDTSSPVPNSPTAVSAQVIPVQRR